MAFSIFFSLTIILMISFVATKKNLHLFEIFFMWMIINIIHHNFLSVVAENLQMFDFVGSIANYWTLVFVRVFLIPLLIIWYFDKTFSGNPYTKWVWLPVGILILTGIDYLAEVLNVCRHTHWKFWWSFIEWFVILMLVNYSWIWYRNLLRKEME